MRVTGVVWGAGARLAIVALLLLMMVGVASATSGVIYITDVHRDGSYTPTTSTWSLKNLTVGDTGLNLFQKAVVRHNWTSEYNNISPIKDNITSVVLYLYYNGSVNSPQFDLRANYSRNDSWGASLQGDIIGESNITDYVTYDELTYRHWVGFDITQDFLTDDNNYSSVSIESTIISADSIVNYFVFDSSDNSIRNPIIEIRWENITLPAINRTYNLSTVGNTVVYERLWDARPKRTIQEHIDIINQLNVSMIFRSNFRVNPFMDSCNNYSDIVACNQTGYSVELQSEIISALKAEKPNLLVIGALYTPRMNRTETDEFTNTTYNGSETYNMSLNLSKWNITAPNQSELQTILTEGIGGFGDTTWYNDITNPTIKQFIINQAKQQIDSGVDGIWLDLTFAHSSTISELQREYVTNRTAAYNGANESYWAWVDVINGIHDYGTSQGKYIYVGGWLRNSVRYSDYFSPDNPPALDFLTVAPMRSELQTELVDTRWDQLINSTNKSYGSIPIFSFIDWAGTNQSQLSYFSQNMTVAAQSKFMIESDVFFESKGIKNMQPMHGGSFYPEATVLGFGQYGWYDSKAPEFYTYPTILALSRNNFSVTPSSGTFNMSISEWNVSADHFKKFNVTALVSTNFSVGDLIPNQSYDILMNGSTLSTSTTNSSGFLSFEHTLTGETQFEIQNASYIPPTPTTLANPTGNFWVNYTWAVGAGNITDSFNVSHNGTWTNGSAINFSNNSVGAGNWSNITVFGWNSSGTGTLSTGSVSQNTQAPSAFTPVNVTIYCPIGWCYLAMNYSSRTLLQLDALYSGDTVVAWYNSTSQKYEQLRHGFPYNTGVSVSQKNGYSYYFSTATAVPVNISSNPSITLRAGWNLVGNMDSARTLAALKTSIGAAATQARHYNINSQSWISSDSEVVPVGEAFFVYVTAQTAWSG